MTSQRLQSCVPLFRSAYIVVNFFFAPPTLAAPQGDRKVEERLALQRRQ